MIYVITSKEFVNVFYSPLLRELERVYGILKTFFFYIHVEFQTTLECVKNVKI